MVNMYSYKGCTVVVTGATGLIGSNLVHALMAMEQVKVIAVSRSKEKAKCCFGDYFQSPRFQFIAQDIAKQLEINEPIHYIFHAAGPVAGSIIKETPLDVILPNLVGVRNCLELLKKQREIFGVQGRMIVFSSATIYGGNDQEKRIVTENDTEIAPFLHDANICYSETKRMVEVIAKAYAQQEAIDIVIGRFSYVYGFSECHPNTAFFEFIDTALCGENIHINSPTLYMRDNIFVDDAVEGILTIGQKGVSGEAYNISSNGELGNYASVDKMANEIISIINKLRKTKESIGVRVPDCGVTKLFGVQLDNSKLKSLGWKIEHSLKMGIEKTIDKIIQ